MALSPPTSPVFMDAISQIGTMAQPVREIDTLAQLEDPLQVELLDRIDQLRHQGLDNIEDISLPQLIVCGEQSSGKSSLLQGLTRLPFPTKEGFCTAFATEVALRKAPIVEIICTINPSKSRSVVEQHELKRFNRTYTSQEEFSLPTVLENAKLLMKKGDRTNDSAFFQDVLKIQYSGPNLPPLTIVDLPGLIETQVEGGRDAEKIKQLVTSYMSRKFSINLAVVPASNDPDNQKVFTYLNEYDPTRSRTLGIITKPDLVDRGGDNEKELLRLAKNEKYPLAYGWHAVRNRSFTTRDQTDSDRDDAESKFFSTGAWASVPRENVGIASLRTKLSRVLLQHISTKIPDLVKAMDTAIKSIEASLEILGGARETSVQQRSYLTRHAEKFQSLTNDASRGIYSNRFFSLTSLDEQTPTRLRTEIQTLNMAFVDVMYTKGHTWKIAEHKSDSRARLNNTTMSANAHSYLSNFREPTAVSRSDFLVKHVGDYVRHSRPAGLPTLINPWVIGEVFRQQAQPWREVAQHHLEHVFRIVKTYIREALSSLMDRRTSTLLMLKQIEPELERRWKRAEMKLEELLLPYTEQDPCTYDPSFIKELRAVRNARYQARAAVAEANKTTLFTYSSNQNNSQHLLLSESADDLTNSEILDLMQTYYNVHRHSLSQGHC